MRLKSSNREMFEWIRALVIALVIALVVRFFFFSPIVVDGPSMQPTLDDRDRMIVNKFVYNVREPERFEIIVFHASEQSDYIKRVIGLPGEHVSYENEKLYIDGEEIEEPFKDRLEDNQAHYMETDPFILEMLPGGYASIPEGYVLVLGDNRNNSTDSRTFGLVDIDSIVGKVSMTYWPLNRIQFMKDR